MSSDIGTRAFLSHSAQGILGSSVRVISDSKVILLVISEGHFEHRHFCWSLWIVILISHFWWLKIVFWPKFWCDGSENIINSWLWIFISAIAMWTCYSALTVPLIENLFSKRSLPLRCFKGENIVITVIISYLWQFFQNGKISRYSHVLCSFQFHNQDKGGLLITILIRDYVRYFMLQTLTNFPCDAYFTNLKN